MTDKFNRLTYGGVKGRYDLDKEKEERLKEKYDTID